MKGASVSISINIDWSLVIFTVDYFTFFCLRDPDSAQQHTPTSLKRDGQTTKMHSSKIMIEAVKQQLADGIFDLYFNQ